MTDPNKPKKRLTANVIQSKAIDTVMVERVRFFQSKKPMTK
jgi:hypothetical protein